MGDFATSGIDAPFVNSATGQRYNNATAATLSQITSQQQAFTQFIFQQMLTSQLIGAQIIAQGAATTEIPDLRKLADGEIARYALPEFARELEQRGFRLTDMADCRAAILALNFEVYSDGQRANAAQLAALRRDLAAGMLKDGFYQGQSEGDRLGDLQFNIARTMIAHRAWRRWKAKTATPEERDAALEAAKAGIKRYWSEGAAAIVLAPEGFRAATPQERLANGSTAFIRGAELLYPASFRSYAPTLTDIYTRFITQFDERVRARAGRTNDLAAVYAAAFESDLEIATGQRLTATQFQSLLAGFEAQIKADPEIQAMSDSNRQLAYEKMAVRAVTIREEGGAEAKASAQAHMKLLFQPRNLGDYALTPAGYEPRW